MRYLSTRGGVSPTPLSGAILAGMAADGGLFVPRRLPRITMTGEGDLPRVARRFLAPFAEDDPLGDELDAIVGEAFNFDAPLRPLVDERTSVLELYHGPSAAFKDFGARFLAACFRRLGARADGLPVTVLVATSGDTGAAVGAAFHRMPGIRVAILYPARRVAPRQAHQLGAFGDNVVAFAVEGTFDDCQRLAKRAFADAALRERLPLVSANSISLGRLLPQAAYYASAALQHARASRASLSFAIPTGNLGNAFACLLARACGLPIGEILLASNANATISEWLATGRYLPRATVATLANAMDVGDPSNAERVRWLHPEPASARIAAESVDDATIRARIAESETRYGALWCPHTACAVEALERRRRAGDTGPWCVVATAHPAKFDALVEPLVGHAVDVPPALAAILAQPSQAERIEADYEALRERLEAG